MINTQLTARMYLFINVLKSMSFKIKSSVLNNVLQFCSLNWTFRSGVYIQVKNIADWVVYSDIFVDGEYDEPINNALVMRANESPLNFLDIGANVGYFSLRVADMLKKNNLSNSEYNITAIEANPIIYKQLCKRISDNLERGILPPSMRPVLGLVGKRTGVGTIYHNRFHAVSSTVGGHGGRRFTVPYVDLIHMLRDTPRIHLLKCDIEGGELEFLENNMPLLELVDSAVFELHSELCDTKRCVELLNEAGFDNAKVLRKTDAFSVCYFRR